MSGEPASAPLVSVLVPVLNGAAFLEECLDSGLAQDYPHLEFVLVDNGSTDATPDIIARYAQRDGRIRTHRHERTIPAAKNFNFCHTLISDESRYVKWLHADDTLRPDCVSRMVALAEAHPSVGLVSCWVDTDEGVRGAWEDAPDVTPGREVIRAYLLREIPYVFGNPTAFLFRSESAKRDRPFYAEDDPLLAQQLDIEACYRVLLESDFGFVREPLIWMRLHEDSITSRNQVINKRLAGQVIMTHRFAPLCMSEDEVRVARDMLMGRYLKFLSQNLGRDREFWEFHGMAMRELGFHRPRARAAAAWASLLPGRVARKLGLAR